MINSATNTSYAQILDPSYFEKAGNPTAACVPNLITPHPENQKTTLLNAFGIPIIKTTAPKTILSGMIPIPTQKTTFCNGVPVPRGVGHYAVVPKPVVDKFDCSKHAKLCGDGLPFCDLVDAGLIKSHSCYDRYEGSDPTTSVNSTSASPTNATTILPKP
jgi:hypothetical protein